MEEAIEILKQLARAFGYDLTPIIVSRLRLGKNRQEAGHTVRYNQLNNVFRELGKPDRCQEGWSVEITTLNDQTAVFHLNAGGRAYCGVDTGARQFEDRAILEVIDAQII